MPPGGPTAEYALEQIARIHVTLGRAQRAVERAAVAPDRRGPLDLVESEEEVGDLGHHVGILHLAQQGDHDAIVERRTLDRLAEHPEVLARHPRVLDLREPPLVRVGIEKMARFDVGGSGLASQVLCLGGDPVEERRGELRLDVELQIAQVLGQDGRRGTVLIAQVEERDVRVHRVGGMVVDHDHGHDLLGEGVVRPSRLRVDQRDLGVAVEAHLAHWHERDV